MPYRETLKKAVAEGVNVLITHEPTFYTHFDLDEVEKSFAKFPEPANDLYLEQVKLKKQWIEENELVIIRCHDVLDIIPDFGIPYAFGRA